MEPVWLALAWALVGYLVIALLVAAWLRWKDRKTPSGQRSSVWLYLAVGLLWFILGIAYMAYQLDRLGARMNGKA